MIASGWYTTGFIPKFTGRNEHVIGLAAAGSTHLIHIKEQGTIDTT